MTHPSPARPRIGLFSMVDDRDRALLIAYSVPLAEVVPYGEMLTIETGHADHWAALARRGGRDLRSACVPSAPLWSEYAEWPRGRVPFDRTSGRFIIRADRALHRPDRVARIAKHFGLEAASATLLPDEHYRSTCRLPSAIRHRRRRPGLIQPHRRGSGERGSQARTGAWSGPQLGPPTTIGAEAKDGSAWPDRLGRRSPSVRGQ